ncbi:MAG TPA: ethanolamine ammonia-lyase reactivating factor EutA [Acidimicrobiales bacterium]|nr:ethanolamine ammonia-lyase reactivating factor EutA [Acidimicrobiales bacterium]
MHEATEHDIFSQGGGGAQLRGRQLVTIGVDVGSTTFHFLFARLVFGKGGGEEGGDGGHGDGVRREILWRSPIHLTPYRGKRIDAMSIGLAIELGHKAARIAPERIDSGAIIFTGEALRAENARALADTIATTAGKFVSVSAGHHLESMLSAYGSGAVGAAREHGETLLHVDIGGGTTKLSVIDERGIRQTAAINGGGRLAAIDDKRRIVRLAAGARPLARHAGIVLEVGGILSEDAARALADGLADAIAGIVDKDTSGTAERRLRLTEPLEEHWKPTAISFSGGVSEYIYGREQRDYGDIGRVIAAAINARLDDGRIALPVIDPGEGIRATVIGAAQSTAQVSGNTALVSGADLPITDVPVVHPHFDADDVRADDVAAGIAHELALYGITGADPVALSISFEGSASYARLRELAAGMERALGAERTAPTVVLIDVDIAHVFGNLLVEEFPAVKGIICLDGLHLSSLDYVDVGEPLESSGVFPVVIKSLLFDVHDHEHVHDHDHDHDHEDGEHDHDHGDGHDHGHHHEGHDES